MTYETKIGVEIEGIRRAVRLDLEYHIEAVNGERQLVHDAVTVHSDHGRMPGNWVFRLIGPRQLKELNCRMLEYWETKTAAQIRGMAMKSIVLSGGHIALIDDDDFERLSRFKWHLSVGKYAAATVNGKQMYMHRLVMGNPPGKEIDHINHNGLDNRKRNLRICEHRENLRAMKRTAPGTSQYRGVYLDRSRINQNRKWAARITVDRKGIFIGRFKTEKDAAAAYQQAARRYFGNFYHPEPIMGKFVKAKSEQAFFKAAIYGKTGSGKTLTSLLWAEKLAERENKRVAFIDTERGTEYYALDIPERTVHPKAFDFDRFITRSLMETLEAVEELDPKVHGVLVIDSITHLWEAARAAYNGKMLSNGGIPIQAWQQIKKPYKRLMSLFLDGSYHAILCGREGVIMEQDEDGEMRVTGTKLKAEGETPHEPHVLGRMCPERDEKGGYIINVFFEKDRSGILTGKEFLWPTYETIAPVVSYLCGGEQGRLGTPEEAAERDISAQEAAQEKAERERKELFDHIRTALIGSKSIQQLQTAWSLTNGKKTRLGDEHFTQLQTIKDSRKAELLEVA